MGLFDRFRSKRPGNGGSGSGRAAFRLANEPEGQASLTLGLGNLATDAAVRAAGEEPNGAFWEGVTAYASPALASRLDMDSEGSLFAVYGDRPDLEELRELLQPLVDQPAAITDLLHRAHKEGLVLEGYGR